MTSKKALILVDLENEWIDEKSDYYIGDISETINKTNKLIAFCITNNYKIIFIRHVEKESNEEFIDGSKNTEIIDTINRESDDALITKYKISAFYKTDLEKESNAEDTIELPVL